ncbi:Translationally-controlled tumor protein [Clonorchis sinensis]|uniref:Translationally-controlled tumor protein homolog n=1 Tax=Clonorchis sinensis TaxID=79923 RepID=A1KZ95_CLOSI|nr:translationally controlled tumor protein [Clonorchis sinensis]KAG5452995.1 Translationally-controlled tumor protein [Clonorchis sinensis]
MRVFKCAISGDEMFSDSHKIKLIDDAIYEVDAKFVNVSNKVDDSLIGANPSAEEAGENLDDGVERVIDLVHGNRLCETHFDQKGFKVYLKDYLKKVKELVAKKDPARVESFQKAVETYMKNVLANFKDYQFFIGEKMDPNGCVALMNYREDGMTPYFVFLKDGLVEEKY